jgi:periplasmic protein TonB
MQPQTETSRKKRKRKEANPLPWVILFVGAVVAALWWISAGDDSSGGEQAAEEVIEITLPPPLPPPPPPPPPVQPPEPPPEVEEEMVEQEPVTEEESPPEEVAQESPPDIDLGPGTPGGTGPSIGTGGGGGRSGSGLGSRGSASRFGWYAAKVQTSIREALSRNPSTRSATFSGLTVKIWADSSGRVTRAQLVGTSGNPAVDSAIKNRILTGLQLPQAPPPEMRMPINLRISARKIQS